MSTFSSAPRIDPRAEPEPRSEPESRADPRVDPDTTGQVKAIDSDPTELELEEEVRKRTESVKKKLQEVRRRFSPPAGIPAARKK